MEKHNVGCMVCGKELVYSGEDRKLKCIYCNGIHKSNVSCSEGHYIWKETMGKKLDISQFRSC